MPDSPGRTLAKAGVASTVIIGGLWLLGLELGWQAAVAFAVLLAGLSYLTDTGGNVDIGYALVTIAVIAMVFEYLVPDSIARLFPNLLAPFGISLSGLNAAEMAAVVFTGIIIYAIIDIRFISQTAKKPETIVKRLSRRLTKLTESYGKAGRALIAGGLAIFAVLLRELGGGALVEAGSIAADAPLVVSNLVVGFIAWVSLGGGGGLSNAPLIGDLTAAGFVVLFILVFGTAYAVNEVRS